MQGWFSGSLVMMLNKNYGMFWVQTQPCTPEQHEIQVLPLTTQYVCVRIDLIIVITCDCVVCTCKDSVGPRNIHNTVTYIKISQFIFIHVIVYLHMRS